MIKRTLALLMFVALVAGLVPALGPDGEAAGAGITVGRVHKQFQPTKGKVFVLVIGTDARSGNPNARADAIHIAGINTRTMRGGILNFPRDTWVSIPGRGFSKINEALPRGGPRLLAKTLERETGIRIDYWVMVGFQGFRNIVKEVGPIRLRIHRRIYDRGSGANIPAGRRRFGPDNGLAYVRTRKAFSGGDVTRATNQGKFLLGMLRKLRSDLDRRPSNLLQWMGATRRHARFDVSPRELYRLAVLTSQVKPGRVKNRTIPVRVGWVGAASVVFAQPGARSLYKRLRRTASF